MLIDVGVPVGVLVAMGVGVVVGVAVGVAVLITVVIEVAAFRCVGVGVDERAWATTPIADGIGVATAAGATWQAVTSRQNHKQTGVMMS